MALPQVRAVGTPIATTAGPTVVLPEHEENDILGLFCETTSEAVAVPSGGWGHVLGSPQQVSAGANSTRKTIFWLRAASAAETDPVVADPGNHVCAVAISFSGCILIGDPWDVTSAGVTTDVANQTLTGGITTVDDCLVILALSTTSDANSTTAFSNWVNAALANLIERVDFTSDVGTGGGFGIATGEKAEAGAYGDTTVDCPVALAGGYLTIALKPEPVATFPFSPRDRRMQYTRI